jgi:hypothetical protein
LVVRETVLVLAEVAAGAVWPNAGPVETAKIPVIASNADANFT